ncbi:MAG: hypothetical protein KDA61_10020, partial [Planctomycetales bacterium]|nr:hypothetical protein [Planctomycetales bacterium]
DAVAFHWYGVSNPNDPVGAANSFLNRVASYHNQYNKPVFITEFALHDWGGAYSDAEMIEANRIFLDVVVPELEQRDYVLGYSWYHWFSDAPLYSGSPAAPTEMGRRYAGAVMPGDVENLGGQDFGEHVAYLAGGEATVNGSAPALRYMTALANTSVVSGNADWGFQRGDALRIQPGAVLRKRGVNQLSLVGGTFANYGTFEANEGDVVVYSTMFGDGDVAVRGGTMRLIGNGSIAAATQIDVARGGMLDGSGLFAPMEVRSGHTMRVTEQGVYQGNLTGADGSVVEGDGTLRGNVLMRSGAVLRVGDAGIVRQSAAQLIDAFQTYDVGKLRDGVADGVWTGVFDGTDNAEIISSGRNRALQFYGTGDAWRGAYADLQNSYDQDQSLADGESATYFFRVQRQGNQTIDGIFGLTDQATIGTSTPWQELSITLSLFQGTGAGDTTALRGFDASSGSDVVVRDGIAQNEWVNVWLLVDNAAKTYQIATSTGLNDGVVFPNVFEFGRSGAARADLTTFAGAEFRANSNVANAAVRIDDLYRMAPNTLAHPTTLTSDPMGQTLLVEGDLSIQANGQIQFDLLTPEVHDRLIVTGELRAGGALVVALDPESAPIVGDAFDIFNFDSVLGDFDQYDLPALQAGMAWNLTGLLQTGVLEVVVDVDLDDDGDVDGDDFLQIQAGDASLISAWESLFGARLATPAG